MASARLGTGIAEFWQTVVAHRECRGASGELDQRRRRQAKAWLWRLVEEGLDSAFRSDPGVAERIQELEREVQAHGMSAPRAAILLLEGFLERAAQKPCPRR